MNTDLKIVIAVHFMLYGAADALEEYLVSRKVRKVYTIRLPFHHQQYQIFKTFVKGRVIKNEKVRKQRAGFLDYFNDFFVVFNAVYRQGEKFDIFIGVNGLNALSGLLLKKMGKVNKVIFYGIDFVPIRFENKLLNFIYHKIEEYCVKNSDVVWNVSPRIAEGREKFLKISKKKHRQKVVPIGVWEKDIVKRKTAKENQIIFVGHLLEKQGVQEVIRAMPIVRKKVKNAKLIIIGGGVYMPELKKITKEEKSHDAVIFTGWITDKKKLKKMMLESSVAVACYFPEKERLRNFTYYADPTKIKDYLSAGLPLVLTNVSHNSGELEKNKCGIIVEYDRRSISAALVKLLENKYLLGEYQQNSLKYIHSFTWDKIFVKALSDI